MLSSFFRLFSPCGASTNGTNKNTSSPTPPSSQNEQQPTASSSSRSSSATQQLVADATGVTKSDWEVENCIFCNVSKERGFDIVYEDEKFVVFRDHRPAAAHHLLVVPRRHIDSVRTLKKEDAPMVARMAEIGHNVLDELKVPVASRRLGFHIPPFYSVKHLHLHVLAAPYKSALMKLAYPVVRGWAGYEKGFGWFAEVEQTIAILEKGGKVKVSSC